DPECSVAAVYDRRRCHASRSPTVADRRYSAAIQPRGCLAYLGRNPIHQLLKGPVLQILIEPPTFNLREYLVEFLARDRLIDETFAATEASEIPMPVLKFHRDTVLPQRQVFRKAGFQRTLGAI